MSEINLLTTIPDVPDRTRDPQSTFNAKTVAWMTSQKENTDDFNANVPALNELFAKADQALDAADESRENAAVATLKAGEAESSAQSALESKEAAQTARTGAEAARTGAEAARDAAVAVAGVGVATTEKAGLVKPDGATLKMVDAAGKMVVEDIAVGGNASDLASSRGRFGKLASGVGITSLRSIGVTCDLFFSETEWNKVTDRPFNSAAGAVVSIRSNEDVSSNRGHILAKSLATGEMWIAYWNATTTSAFRKVITTTDVATRSTPGVIKVGKGLATSGDGTLRYAGMSAATLDVGGNTRLNASSARNFVLTATGASPNVFLPEPSALYAGEQFTFFVDGDNILVRDFKGQTVGPALTRGKAYLLTLIDKTTGEWARAEFSASGISGENGGSLGLQPRLSAPVIFSDVAEKYSDDIELETGRVLHFGSSVSSNITDGTLSLVSITGWSAVSVQNTSLTLPQDFILSDFRKMSSSMCCVLAKDTTTKNKFAIIPVDVSGDTAVVGAADILTTTGTLGKFIFSRVDDNHALLVYGDGTSLYARLYSFSGSTVTAATPVLVREASSTDINKLNIQRMDDTRWLLWTGGFVLQVLGVSGTAITVGEPVTFTPDASWTKSDFMAVSPAPGGNVLIYFSYTYKTGVITTKTVYALLVYTSSGLVLTKGNMTELSREYISPMFFNIDGHMFLLGEKSNGYYLVPVTVDNGTATVGVDFKFLDFDSNSTLLTYTEDTYAIRYMFRDSKDRIFFEQKNFTIAPDGSLTESDPPGYATSISNFTWGRNPCIQAFPGGPYAWSAGYTVNKTNSDGSTTTIGRTTVHVMDSSFKNLCEASLDDFVAKPFDGSSGPISSPYLYPSLFQTGEYQVLVILNHYDTRKPAWALFTL